MGTAQYDCAYEPSGKGVRIIKAVQFVAFVSSGKGVRIIKFLNLVACILCGKGLRTVKAISFCSICCVDRRGEEGDVERYDCRMLL